MARDVGLPEVVGALKKHAREVHRDVARADDDGPLGVEIDLVVSEVRVPVVPGHEAGRSVAADQ